MSIDTTRSFSHAVYDHKGGSSGFQPKDIVTETFHNSLDANANSIHYEFISNNVDENYLIILDDGDGSDNPSSFFAMGNSIIKKDNLIGCKNIGFLASITVTQPLEVLILTKKKECEDTKTFRYKTREHHNILNDIRTKYNGDYKKINDAQFFNSDISTTIKNLIKKNKDYISSDGYNLFEFINEKQGCAIILKLEIDIFEKLCEEIVDDLQDKQNKKEEKVKETKVKENKENPFITKLSLMTTEIDKIKFYRNGINKKKSKYVDILYQGYKPIIIDTNYIEISEKKDQKKYFEQNIYINEKNHNNLIFTQYYLLDKQGNFNHREKISYKLENIKGNFIINYYFYDQKYWEKLSPELDASEKRCLIYDFFDSKYRIFTETKEKSDSIYSNGGSFLISLFINNKNMEFAEKYLGIQMNKSLTSPDSFDKDFKKYIFLKVRDVLVNNISHYNKSVKFGKFKKWIEEYKKSWYNFDDEIVQFQSGNAIGVKDWSNYKEYIKEIFENKEHKIAGDFNNMFIEEYIDSNNLPPKPQPKPLPPPNIKPSAPKPLTPAPALPIVTKPKPSTPLKPIKPSKLKIEIKPYWYEVDIISNINDFDEIKVEYLHDNEKKIFNIDSEKETIKGLNDSNYTFTLIGIVNKKEVDRISKTVKPNIKIKPEKPNVKIDDSTHDIKIKFIDPINHGLPIKKILLTLNQKRLPPIDYKDEITLSNFVHKKSKIEIEFQNEAATSDKTEKELNVNCERSSFTKQIRDQALINNNYKCAVTGIHIDEQYFRSDFDHKDGKSCNNSLENCQPLLVEIHNVKSNNNELYTKLTQDHNELFNYKLFRIKAIYDSLLEEEKEKININIDFNKIEMRMKNNLSK
jgi:hypothetical protein